MKVVCETCWKVGDLEEMSMDQERFNPLEARSGLIPGNPVNFSRCCGNHLYELVNLWCPQFNVAIEPHQMDATPVYDAANEPERPPDGCIGHPVGFYHGYFVWMRGEPVTVQMSPEAQAMLEAAAVAVPPPPVDLNRLLGTSLAVMVRDYPEAPDVRGLILRQTSLWVPDDVAPSGIADWLSQNYRPPVRTSVAAASGTLAAIISTAPATAAVAPPPGADINIDVSFWQRESGHCRYSRDEHYGGIVGVDPEALETLVREAEDEDHLISTLVEWCRDYDNVDSSLMDVIEIENEEYDMHESNDTGSREDISINNQSDLIAALRQRFPDADCWGEEPVAVVAAPLPDPVEEEDEPEHDEPDEEDEEDDNEPEEEEEDEPDFA